MDLLPKCLLAATLVWAVASLAWQAWRSRSHFGREMAAPRGRSADGVRYALIKAVEPGKKESVTLHPGAFVLGLGLHLGAIGSLILTCALAALPAFQESLKIGALILAPIGLTAALVLLVRRALSPELRPISPLMDYLANLAVTAFLIVVLLFGLGWIRANGVAWTAALLLVYLPLGKLRHGIFFFLARAELGTRLGWRGAYPPESPERSRR